MHANKKYKNQIFSTEAILFVLQKYFHNGNHKLQSSLVHHLFLLFSVQSVQCKGNSLCTHTIGGKFTAGNMHSDYYCYHPVALRIITDLHCISKGYDNKKRAANMRLPTHQVCLSSLEVSRSCTTDGTST